MLIENVHVRPRGVQDRAVWPRTVPAIGQLLAHGVEFTSDIMILVGANGSGKSTLLEAIAARLALIRRQEIGHRGRWLDAVPAVCRQDRRVE
ncbi:AAA family ATPase [Promicromonospora kroppenstedtii]|uniref:AAA family ATPase n=1 Tax=Promicromonospora kroppenstedtii TaxID=440482 RepID=A0ABW7XF43_9MICO